MQTNVNLSMLDPDCAANHSKENQWFCHSLQEMVQDGAAEHTVNAFNKDQNGHGAMVAIKEWHEGDESMGLLADNAQWQSNVLCLKPGGSFRSHC